MCHCVVSLFDCLTLYKQGKHMLRLPLTALFLWSILLAFAVRQALWLLWVMQRHRLQPNIVSYSAAISACEKAGRWQLAVLLLALCENQRNRPNLITYNTATWLD